MISESIKNGTYFVGDNLPILRSFKARRFRMTIYSPPYEDRRTYGTGFDLIGQKWVDWLIPRVVESCRVTDGIVFVVVAAPVRNHSYSAAVEWLVADLTRNCGIVCAQSPYAWVKMEDRDDARPNGIPGSGGKRYHRRDWEPVYCFALPDRLPVKYADNLANGLPPLLTSFGGEFSNRDKDGKRANDPWKMDGRSGVGPRKENGKRYTNFRNGKDGTVKGNHARDICKVANAGNVIQTVEQYSSVVVAPVGGGKLGHPVAHEGEAPFPCKLVRPFIQCFSKPGDEILDAFASAGTTPQVCEELGRRWIAIDNRESELEKTRRRLNNLERATG